MAEPVARTTILGSASSAFQFRVDYERIKRLSIGWCVHSDVVSAGGHRWRIAFFPRGVADEDNGEYISLLFTHRSKSRSVRAVVDAFIMGRDGKAATPEPDIHRICETFERPRVDRGSGDSWGWYQFRAVTDVEKNFVIERHITFLCTIMVIDDSPISEPPSDIGTHLGHLLDHTDGTDVSFTIDDQRFHGRSPVFKAELSMDESTWSSITLHDITPATSEAILQFKYIDERPVEDMLEDSSTEMIQNVLVAADRYALDRLKFICAQKLCAKVSVDTVAAMLGFAETYSCQELKNKCIDFFAVEENFKQAMFTNDYAMLVLKFPLIIAELKKRVRA